MEKRLSFEPRYHEIRTDLGEFVWAPMYNPDRECVQAERRQLKAEGVRVETSVWKMPPMVRRRMLRDTIAAVEGLLIYLLVSFFFGEQLVKVAARCGLSTPQSWPLHVVVATLAGAVALLGPLAILHAVIERKRNG